MAKIRNLLLFVMLINFSGACQNQNPCLCEIDDYHRIDITQLSTDLKTEFLIDADDGGSTYYFHGCQDAKFNLTQHGVVNSSDSIVNISLIKLKLNITANPPIVKNVLNLTASQMKFQKNEDHYALVFTDGSTVFVTIQLVCSSFKTSYIKVLPTAGSTPKLLLSSPLSCPILYNHGMGTFSIFLLLILIAFGIYFIGGCLILYFMRGARGLEMIPHIDFWKSIPGKLKNAFIFLFSGCNPSTMVTTAETYDRI